MDNKEKNFVSAVIYVHNAEDGIGFFLNSVRDVICDNFENSEIICVNDSSNDRSVYEIEKAVKSAAGTSVSIVNMSYYHGLELAMNAGVDLAIGDYVFEFDNSFLDFEPEMILNIYQRALEGYDIVSASPDRREKVSSQVFYGIFDRFSNRSYRMATESFRILSRRVINRISSMNNIILYRKAVYANCGLKTDIYKYKPVADGLPRVDKVERYYRRGLALDSLILFTELGYRFSMIMTMVMMLISMFVLAYTVVTYFALHPVEGWTTTILFLSVCFIGLFGIQTIIIKYLQLLVTVMLKRRHYSFESIQKLT